MACKLSARAKGRNAETVSREMPAHLRKFPLATYTRRAYQNVVKAIGSAIVNKPTWKPETETDERLQAIAGGKASDLRSHHARIIADKVLTARKAGRA